MEVHCEESKKGKGEAYVNTVGISVPAKEVLPLNCKCRFKCSEAFIDDVRSKICAEYYALGDFCRQKDYILQRLIIRPVKTRQIVSREISGKEAFSQNRQISIAYYMEHAASRHRVCQSFFLKTLCISNRAVLTAVEGRTDSGTFGQMDGRGRQPPVNNTDAEHKRAILEHIKSFPAVESHYCRKDSQWQYLDRKQDV